MHKQDNNAYANNANNDSRVNAIWAPHLSLPYTNHYMVEYSTVPPVSMP